MTYLLTDEHCGIPMYLTTEGYATDLLERAQRFQNRPEAQKVADLANLEPAWKTWGFNWTPVFRGGL